MNGRDETQALLLVGHGSAYGPDAGAPVRAHAERIRRWGIFDEVATAFVKEAPPLAGAIDRLESTDVYVVPLFLAEGYYTRGVVPRELGLPERVAGVIGAAAYRVGGPVAYGAGGAAAHGADGPVAHGERVQRSTLSGRRVHYSPAVGSHPAMLRAIERRIRGVLGSAAAAADTALVVIGHGTDRHPASADTVFRLTARLRRSSHFAEVLCGFLDQEPRIDRVVDRVRASRVVLVPYFLADGMHTRETIPEVLRLDGPRTERAGRVLWYTRPVGTLPFVAKLAVDLARRAGARVPGGVGG